tara:strand:- start:1378 stop:2466 length:1089 start_codon:yes stop_codon:yes gene_type:complete
MINNYVLSLLVFIVILFFYIHIYHHYKTSNDLEVYTLENPTRDKLEEVCNLRQPFVFNYNNEDLITVFRLDSLIHKFGNFDIKIRNIKNYDDESEMYLPFTLDKSKVLLTNDKKNKYITENNGDFIDETGLRRLFEKNDEFLRPPLLSNNNYDFLCGSKDTITPLRYNISYRNYIYVTNGKVKVKLVCPNDSKYLNKIKDYENFEFRSPLNLWNIQENYKDNFGKIRFVDIELEKGNMLYLPAYWWYSIKFDENTQICTFKYRTYMNNIAILPDLVMYFLQRQNIKHNLMKRFDNQEIKCGEETEEIHLGKKNEQEEQEEQEEEEEEQEEQEEQEGNGGMGEVSSEEETISKKKSENIESVD